MNNPSFGDNRLPGRFWSKVEQRGICWIWIAATYEGYGRIHYNGKQSSDRSATRLSGM